ncbi:DUF2851 family protein [candidate division WOR-3 bacterium]|nr:DUF2851 family protein [candidate division WOR-3 bacterium]
MIKNLSEKFLQWLWENQFLNLPLATTDGVRIEILSPGIPNQEDGPDFKHAIIKFDNRLTQGDVEVHRLSNDWNLHHHEIDPKYNNVLLHVVWKYNSQDILTQSGRILPTLELLKFSKKSISKLLKDYNEKLHLEGKERCPYVSFKTLTDILEAQGINRFNERKQKFKKLIKVYELEQAIYIGIMESLGYVKNKAPFVELARLAPISKLRYLSLRTPRDKRVEIIKISLLGVADLLSEKFQREWGKIKKEFKKTMRKEVWQFFKVRPPGFPEKRIEGISYFLKDVIDKGFSNFLLSHNMKEIENKIAQGGISKSCARTTILNVCLPVLAILYEGNADEQEVLQIYRNYKRLPENSRTRKMSKILCWNKKMAIRNKRNNREIYYQGMIHIFHHYCHTKQCTDCPIKKKQLDKNKFVEHIIKKGKR